MTATTRPFERCGAICALVALWLFSIAASTAASDPVGAVFLRVGVGARSAGLADADIVGASDASVLHWNPAGLARLPRRELLLLHNEWLGDVRQEYAGAVFPLGRGGWGVGVNGFYVGNIPRYTSDVPTENAQGDFGAYDLAIQAGYGRELVRERLAVGLGTKAIVRKIDLESALSFAADVAVLYDAPIRGLSAAVVAANLGPPIDFRGVNEALPAEARVGLGYRFPIGPVDAGAYSQLRASRRLNPRAHFGVEASFRGLSLRLGDKLGYDAEDLSYGVGYEVGRFAFDYAFVSFSEELLGESHRVSLSFSP